MSETKPNFETFWSDVISALGRDSVNLTEETCRRYGENTMPGGDRLPAGVVYPASTADVQAIVSAHFSDANEDRWDRLNYHSP